MIWFHDSYQGPKHYFKGIGTKFGELGKIIGGVTGAGGRDRIRDAVNLFHEDRQKGDTTVDVVEGQGERGHRDHRGDRPLAGEPLGDETGDSAGQRRPEPRHSIGGADGSPATARPITARERAGDEHVHHNGADEPDDPAN